MIIHEPKYKPYGAAAILVEWPAKVDVNILSTIQYFYETIQLNNIEPIVEVNYVYSSLLIIYDNSTIEFSELKTVLESLYSNIDFSIKNDYRCYQIPACYDIDYGPDLEFMCNSLNMEHAELVKLHTSTDYIVFGYGFLPGFLYLGGLDNRLHFPRRNNPRLKVPKGAVGIGGKQTGIYPMESPGGWQLIGQTPIELFDVRKDPPGFIKSGDRIRFKAIDKIEYKQLAQQIESENFNYKQLLL